MLTIIIISVVCSVFVLAQDLFRFSGDIGGGEGSGAREFCNSFLVNMSNYTSFMNCYYADYLWNEQNLTQNYTYGNRTYTYKIYASDCMVFPLYNINYYYSCIDNRTSWNVCYSSSVRYMCVDRGAD